MLGVDMSSTGEVGCLGDDLNEALLKSVISIGNEIPVKGVLLSTGDAVAKADMLPACKMLSDAGLTLYATTGTWQFLCENDIVAERALWPGETAEGEDCRYALDLLHAKDVDMVINISRQRNAGAATNGYKVRRTAIDCNIPLFTNTRLATAWIRAFTTGEAPQIKSWDEY